MTCDDVSVSHRCGGDIGHIRFCDLDPDNVDIVLNMRDDDHVVTATCGEGEMALVHTNAPYSPLVLKYLAFRVLDSATHDLPLTVEDNLNGSYFVLFTPTAPGAHEFHAKVFGVHIRERQPRQDYSVSAPGAGAGGGVGGRGKDLVSSTESSPTGYMDALRINNNNNATGDGVAYQGAGGGVAYQGARGDGRSEGSGMDMLLSRGPVSALRGHRTTQQDPTFPPNQVKGEQGMTGEQGAPGRQGMTVGHWAPGAPEDVVTSREDRIRYAVPGDYIAPCPVKPYPVPSRFTPSPPLPPSVGAEMGVYKIPYGVPGGYVESIKPAREHRESARSDTSGCASMTGAASKTGLDAGAGPGSVDMVCSREASVTAHHTRRPSVSDDNEYGERWKQWPQMDVPAGQTLSLT